MTKTSRHRLIDTVEYIANNIALASHFQEILNSEMDESFDKSWIEEQRNKSIEDRRNAMQKIKDEFIWDPHLWCILKHSIAMYGYATEMLYANKRDTTFIALQQNANDNLFIVLSKFIGEEVTTCGRCFNDMILNQNEHTTG